MDAGTATGATEGGVDAVDVVDVVSRLAGADTAAASWSQLDAITRDGLRVRGWLDALDAKVAGRATVLRAQRACEEAGSLLTGNGRRSRRDAAAAAARGLVCESMPQVGDALENGGLGAGHVDAIAAASRGLNETEKERLAEHGDSIVEAAERLTPEQFGREMKDLARVVSDDDGVSDHERLRRHRAVKRWVDRATGMHHTRLDLDPETDAKVWTAINSAVAAARAGKQDADLTYTQLQADSVVDLLTHGDASGGPGPAPEVGVLIDWQTLDYGPHANTTAETYDGVPLPVATIRRMCCDANIYPIVLGGDGEVLDVGRSARLATRAHRRALRAMYRTCAHPDCDVPFDNCRIHHLVDWLHGGATDLANLLPLCERHHHVVHEGGWTVTVSPQREATWIRPDGSTNVSGHPDRTRRSGLLDDDIEDASARCATPERPNGRDHVTQACKRPSRAVDDDVAITLEEALDQILSRPPPTSANS